MVAIIEAATRTQTIFCTGHGIQIFRHEFIKLLGEPAVGGVIPLASRHDPLSVRLGDLDLKIVVDPKKPKRQGGNSYPYQREPPTGTLDRVLEEADKNPDWTNERRREDRSRERPVPG
jgi:hypothetical protein